MSMNHRDLSGPIHPIAQQSIHIIVSTKLQFQNLLCNTLGAHHLAAINASINPFILSMTHYNVNFHVYIFIIYWAHLASYLKLWPLALTFMGEIMSLQMISWMVWRWHFFSMAKIMNWHIFNTLVWFSRRMPRHGIKHLKLRSNKVGTPWGRPSWNDTRKRRIQKVCGGQF